MQSACRTNLAPECLRIDRIARFTSSLSLSLPPTPFPMHIPPDAFACTRVYRKYSKILARIQSTRVPVANARVLTSHEEESLVSFLHPLFSVRALRRSPLLTRGLSSFLIPCSSSPCRVGDLLSLSFPSYRALFQSLVVAVYHARAETHAILFEPFA